MKSRRAVLKKLTYIAPAIITLVAIPAFASNGSDRSHRGKRRSGWWSWLFG